jgi:hypothetical protein
VRRHATKRGTSWPEICKVALRLPGVVKGMSYGTPALHVGKRFLARLKEDGETIAIKIDFSDRDVLLELDPEAFYLTDHYRPYPAMLVRLKQVRRGLLEEVIERAWRRQAPKSLVGRGPLGTPGSTGHGAATNDTAAEPSGRQRRRRSRTTRR